MPSITVFAYAVYNSYMADFLIRIPDIKTYKTRMIGRSCLRSSSKIHIKINEIIYDKFIIYSSYYHKFVIYHINSLFYLSWEA